MSHKPKVTAMALGVSTDTKPAFRATFLTYRRKVSRSRLSATVRQRARQKSEIPQASACHSPLYSSYAYITLFNLPDSEWPVTDTRPVFSTASENCHRFRVSTRPLSNIIPR